MKTSNKLLILFVSVSVILSVVTYLYLPFYELIGFDKGLEGVLLFSSISLGFYGACLSVLASIFNTKVVQSILEDKDEKKEFSYVIFGTLITGFLTVFLTIAYRVIIASNILTDLLQYINAVWVFFTLCFISMDILFISISFLVFLNNSDKKKKAPFVPQGKVRT